MSYPARAEGFVHMITQKCCEQYWTSPGSSTPQNSSCTATHHPSRKLSMLEETRHVGYCLRSRDELISDILLWTPLIERAKAGRPSRTYTQQLCADTGCSLEDLPEVMDYIYIYIYIMLSLSLCIYIYHIYIYISYYLSLSLCLYIYIYIYI